MLWHIHWLVRGTMHHQQRQNALSQASLCTNCLNAPDCVMRKAARGQVQYCDLHEVACPLQAVLNGTAGTENRYAFVPLAGLCSNCDHVRTCVLRQPDRTVLHCQHYE